MILHLKIVDLKYKGYFSYFPVNDKEKIISLLNEFANPKKIASFLDENAAPKFLFIRPSGNL